MLFVVNFLFSLLLNSFLLFFWGRSFSFGRVCLLLFRLNRCLWKFLLFLNDFIGIRWLIELFFCFRFRLRNYVAWQTINFFFILRFLLNWLRVLLILLWIFFRYNLNRFFPSSHQISCCHFSLVCLHFGPFFGILKLKLFHFFVILFPSFVSQNFIRSLFLFS